MIAKPLRPSRRIKQHMDAACRAAGCTCRRPDHELVAWYHDELQHLLIHHDPGCPAIAAGRMAVVIPPRKPS